MAHRDAVGHLTKQLTHETRKIVFGTVLQQSTSTVMATYPRTSRFINQQQMVPNKRGALPVKGIRYPSVTTILSCTMPSDNRERLENWMNNKVAELGKSGFYDEMYFRKKCSQMFHKAIATYLLHGRKKSTEIPVEIEGYWNSIRMFLPEVEPAKAWCEDTVTHPILCYRGRFDAILRYRHKYVLVDWKCASPESSRSNAALDHLRCLNFEPDRLRDDPLQLAAYLGAINYERKIFPGHPLKHGVIVLAQQNGDLAHVIELDKKIMYEAWNRWRDRVRRFWLSMNSTPAGEGISFIPEYETTNLTNRVFEKVPKKKKLPDLIKFD